MIIPAHDEEAVIARGLERLTAGAERGELEIIVVCNGCHDATAARARGACPEAIVLELPIASKSAALNAGDAVATCFPRLYVDADVELPIGALRATAACLGRGDVLCAAPAPSFDLTGRGPIVRAYYEVWQQLPYHTEAMVGTGVYGLSAAGRARFHEFPDLTADDQFVLQQFSVEERSAVPGERFIVHTPRSVRGLVAIRRRAYRGAAELAASGRAPHPPASGGPRRLRELARDPRRLPALAVYVTISVYAKMLARWGRHRGWERDDSARRVVPPAKPVP